jgi:uncharacterized protein (DUF1697 family)
MVANGREPSGGVHVALLRGVNVGGKNSVPMKRLVALCFDAGCRDVQTYIQSGNIVFRATDAIAHRIPSLIGKELLSRLGLRIPVVMRTSAELGAVARSNPFLEAGVDAERVHVAFLADRPSTAQMASLDPDRSPPDAFAVRGREIYLHCPNGLARTKLTNGYFDSRLGTTSTVRNWHTVLKLLELTRAKPGVAAR